MKLTEQETKVLEGYFRLTFNLQDCLDDLYYQIASVGRDPDEVVENLRKEAKFALYVKLTGMGIEIDKRLEKEKSKAIVIRDKNRADTKPITIEKRDPT